jgi:DNA-binding NarL/FixJ family response regulator
MPINVSIVEDNTPFRESLKILLSGGGDFVCSGAHPTAEAALASIPEEKPDVVLMDIQLPGKSGVECVQALKQALPNVPIMMLTAYEDSDMIFNSLAAGACGYLLKRTPPHELLQAVQELHRGGSPMSTPIARKVVASFQKASPGATKLPQLTERENEILAHLARGFRNKEIADMLKISLDTIRTHLRHIYEKLHVQSRTEAVLKFLQK